MGQTTFYSVAISSCGRRKLDLERVKRYLTVNGWEQVDRAEMAQYIFIAACVSTAANINRSIKTIQELSSLKRVRLVVLGCVQQERLITILQKTQNILCWFTPRQGLENLDNVLRLPTPIADIPDVTRMPDNKGTLIIRVQYGCSGTCTYCIAKKSIGYPVSKPLDHCLQQIKKELSPDIKKIRLTGDDIGSYGMDIGLNFQDLVESICLLRNGRPLVFDNLNSEYLVKYEDTILKLVKDGVIFHMQIPIQHTNERILRLMRRYPHRECLRRVTGNIAEAGHVHMETHFIVGFPSETEEELTEGAAFCLHHLPFGRIGFYPYEDNEEAASYSLRPKVSLTQKKRRMHTIQQLCRPLGNTELRYVVNSSGLFEVRVTRPTYEFP